MFSENFNFLLYQVPFIAMYRKEECGSLFKDQESQEAGMENQYDSVQKPTLRWHKVIENK